MGNMLVPLFYGNLHGRFCVVFAEVNMRGSFWRFRMVIPVALMGMVSVFGWAQSGAVAHKLDIANRQPQAEILVLGSYHMENPARDLFDVTADDVRSAKRQKEIEDLATILRRFHPNKIALEYDVDEQQKLNTQYQEYLDGKRVLSANERQQIGFRLGKQLGLKSLFAIDTMWEFPYAAVQNWALANGEKAQLEALTQQGKESAERMQQFLEAHTLSQIYQWLNSDSYVREDMAAYARMSHFGDDQDEAGSQLLVHWYERNTRIYTALLRRTEPGDRILVIYGAGHLGPLRRLIQDDPTLQLRRLDEFMEVENSQPAK